MTLPRPNQLIRVEHFPFGTLIVCTFRFNLISGPTTALTEWLIRTTAGVTNPTSITLLTNQIRLVNPLWTAPADPDLIDYTRGPVLYLADDNREVQSFQEPIPFP